MTRFSFSVKQSLLEYLLLTSCFLCTNKNSTLDEKFSTTYRSLSLLCLTICGVVCLTQVSTVEAKESIAIQHDLQSSKEKIKISLQANWLRQQWRKNLEIAQAKSTKVPESIVVKNFKVVGSTVFSSQELAKITKLFTDRPLTFAELLQVRSAITELYTSKGYINSGAFIPPQELQRGIVTVEVIEGELEAIDVTVDGRLNSEYIRSRLGIATSKPLNVNTLLEALQLLRLNPLIENISAELSAGANPGQSLLDVKVKQADAFTLEATYDNARSPSVGSDRRIIGLSEGNLLGWGDNFDFRYTNTDGSNAFDTSYTLPINPYNGTFRFAFGTTDNDVIEKPFNPLDIESKSHYYEITYRQPLFQKANQEFVIGVTASRTESETSLLDEAFPLSRGADEEGNTKISALRFFQEWTQRNEQEVLAARSQFSMGLNGFDATLNDDAPDSQFFVWRGQGQWVRRLGEDAIFLLKGDLQVAGGALIPLEQFSLGGASSVRGYRQDLLLSDSGFFASAEARLPIFRISKIKGVMQITPFVDFGIPWNTDEVELNPENLVSVGVGLNWQQGDRFNARLDWGIPLVEVDVPTETLQEDGVYFSLNYKLF